MPQMIEIDGNKRPVATEEELLEFTNSIRDAGGAGALEALLPSVPSSPTRCLVANALNFGCEVAPYRGFFADGSEKWAMYLPENLTRQQRAALNTVKGARLMMNVTLGHTWVLTLPKHIGNAAMAFDCGLAFQSYINETVCSLPY